MIPGPDGMEGEIGLEDAASDRSGLCARRTRACHAKTGEHHVLLRSRQTSGRINRLSVELNNTTLVGARHSGDKGTI